MIDTDPRHEQRTAAATDARSRRSSHAGSARRRRSASISDAVIAAYIHDLRHALAPARAPRGATAEEAG